VPRKCHGKQTVTPTIYDAGREDPMTERAWWNSVADPGDDFDLSHLDIYLQVAFDELHHPDPQLIVRTLYGNRPEIPHWHYWALVRRARQRWWPHLVRS
jgi:hypothetical protein